MSKTLYSSVFKEPTSFKEVYAVMEFVLQDQKRFFESVNGCLLDMEDKIDVQLKQSNNIVNSCIDKASKHHEDYMHLQRQLTDINNKLSLIEIKAEKNE